MKQVRFPPRVTSPLRKLQRCSKRRNSNCAQLPSLVNECPPLLSVPVDVIERILRSETLSCEDVINASRTCKHMNMGQSRITRIICDKRLSMMKSISAKYRNMALSLVTKRTSPMHEAVKYGCLDIVEQLCQNHQGVDTKDRQGLTPLIMAAEMGATDIAAVLLRHGADVDAVDRDQESALFRAAYAGQLNVIKLLLENGANVHTSAHDDVTPLYIAVVEGHYDVAEHLLDNCADPNAADWEGCTPLTMAIREESEDLALLLLSRGADINVRLLDGNTLLHFAIEIESQSMVRLLLEKGIDFSALNAAGRTALALSNFVGNDGVFDFINRFLIAQRGHAVWE